MMIDRFDETLILKTRTKDPLIDYQKIHPSTKQQKQKIPFNLTLNQKQSIKNTMFLHNDEMMK